MSKMKTDLIRGKWCMDDATTLEEAAQKLEAFAAQLRGLAAQGWELESPVDDDYGHIRREPLH